MINRFLPYLFRSNNAEKIRTSKHQFYRWEIIQLGRTELSRTRWNWNILFTNTRRWERRQSSGIYRRQFGKFT